MLKIRLQRVGRKNDASFRVVVTESTKGPKAGNAVEVLGFYDPKRDVSEIKKDRVEYWMSVGAQVSDTVHNLFVKNKIVKGDTVNVLPKKSPIVSEIEAEEVAAEDVVEEESSEEAPEAPVEAKEDEVVEEKPAEETVEEKPAEESKEEVPAEKSEEETKEEK